jgi:hypothetical protein
MRRQPKLRQDPPPALRARVIKLYSPPAMKEAILWGVPVRVKTSDTTPIKLTEPRKPSGEKT